MQIKFSNKSDHIIIIYYGDCTTIGTKYSEVYYIFVAIILILDSMY